MMFDDLNGGRGREDRSLRPEVEVGGIVSQKEEEEEESAQRSSC